MYGVGVRAGRSVTEVVDQTEVIAAGIREPNGITGTAHVRREGKVLGIINGDDHEVLRIITTELVGNGHGDVEHSGTTNEGGVGRHGRTGSEDATGRKDVRQHVVGVQVIDVDREGIAQAGLHRIGDGHVDRPAGDGQVDRVDAATGVRSDDGVIRNAAYVNDELVTRADLVAVAVDQHDRLAVVRTGRDGGLGVTDRAAAEDLEVDLLGNVYDYLLDGLTESTVGGSIRYGDGIRRRRRGEEGRPRTGRAADADVRAPLVGEVRGTCRGNGRRITETDVYLGRELHGVEVQHHDIGAYPVATTVRTVLHRDAVLASHRRYDRINSRRESVRRRFPGEGGGAHDRQVGGAQYGGLSVTDARRPDDVRRSDGNAREGGGLCTGEPPGVQRGLVSVTGGSCLVDRTPSVIVDRAVKSVPAPQPRRVRIHAVSSVEVDADHIGTRVFGNITVVPVQFRTGQGAARVGPDGLHAEAVAHEFHVVSTPVLDTLAVVKPEADGILESGRHTIAPQSVPNNAAVLVGYGKVLDQDDVKGIYDPICVKIN